MLLLHGLTDAADTWAPIAEPWSHEHRVVAVDLRGHGQSPRLTDAELASNAAEVMTEDVVQLVQRVATDRGPLTVLGQSLGAVLALEAATRSPISIRALVLEDHAPAEGDWGPGVKQPFLDEQIRMLDAFEAVDLALRPTLSPRWSAAEIERCLAAKPLVDRRLIISGNITPPGRLADLVDALEVPTLILVADPSHLDDILPPPSNPLVRLEKIPGAGHCIHRDEPAQFHHLVDGWLGQQTLVKVQAPTSASGVGTPSLTVDR